MKAQGIAVLILPDELPERTRSGRLVIPKTLKEKPKTGTVIECGPGCQLVNKGSRVHFSRNSASLMTIDGKDYYWVQEIPSQIFYVE